MILKIIDVILTVMTILTVICLIYNTNRRDEIMNMLTDLDEDSYEQWKSNDYKIESKYGNIYDFDYFVTLSDNHYKLTNALIEMIITQFICKIILLILQ